MATKIITTVTLAAAGSSGGGAYDLVDLDSARDELNITGNDHDAFLMRAITQASKTISQYCNRVFPVEIVRDLAYIDQDPYPYQTPGGVRPLQLSRWPLVNTGVVSFTGDAHGTTVIDGISSTSGLAAGMPIFGTGVSAGTKITVVAANSITVSQNVTAGTAVSFSTGVQVVQTLGNDGDTQTLSYGSDFDIDPDHGWLLRLNPYTLIETTWEALPVTVDYAAGYAAIPDDLQEATLRLVTARYRARSRDPNLMQEATPNVGETRYWVGARPGQNGAFAPEIAAILDNYRVPVTQ